MHALRFEGDLIQTSEIKEDSYFRSLSIMSLNFMNKSPSIAPSDAYGMPCMYQ